MNTNSRCRRCLSNPLVLSLTGGQTHDITQAETLMAEVEPEAVLSDKGYGSDGFLASLERRDIQAVIPPKANRRARRECDYAHMPIEI